jgi:hypothetical protein
MNKRNMFGMVSLSSRSERKVATKLGAVIS